MKSCAGVISTPARANSIAGSASSRQGSLPKRRCTSWSPFAAPGTAQEAPPTEKFCQESGSNSTVISSICASALRPKPSPGTQVKKSARRVTPRSASCTSRKPPAPGPASMLSVTQEAKAAATQASTADPPSASTLAPASAVRGWPAAIAPRMEEA